MDFNLNLRLGDIQTSRLMGGLENNLAFKDKNFQDLEIKISPYLSIVSPGVLWQLKINWKVVPFTLDEMIEGFIGITAEF